MKVLVVGKGGREHAIVKAISLSKQVDKLYCAPGNPGMSNIATLVPIQETDITNLVEFAKREKIDLTVVGPEASLALGIVDAFKKENLNIFGPTKEATQIESSKEFAKKIMKKYHIPTANYESFNSFDNADQYLKKAKYPIVIKFDGLAAGKGVIIANNYEEANKAIEDIFINKVFGDGNIIIEEFLEGPEFSLMAFVGNNKVYPMVLAQDHKRAYDHDLGPNTGGMGAYSPVDFITDEDINYAIEKIMKPTINGLWQEGIHYEGVLYGGLMKTKDGIKVIEFNARFGDPETEVVLPRLTSDIVSIFMGISSNNHNFDVKWANEKTVGVVLASKGYPGKYQSGFLIEGLDKVDALVYHMGTKLINNNYYTNGGRVLFVVAKGKTIDKALEKVYQEINKIHCDNLYYRTDIAYQALSTKRGEKND